jgi:hypothetical protein
MKSLGWNCYCYKEECNQKEWERQGRTGKRQWTVVQDILISKELNPNAKVPKCPYCKKKMVVTANLGDE